MIVGRTTSLRRPKAEVHFAESTSVARATTASTDAGFPRTGKVADDGEKRRQQR
jgi:hypothetical protein